MSHDPVAVPVRRLLVSARVTAPRIGPRFFTPRSAIALGTAAGFFLVGTALSFLILMGDAVDSEEALAKAPPHPRWRADRSSFRGEIDRQFEEAQVRLCNLSDKLIEIEQGISLVREGRADAARAIAADGGGVRPVSVLPARETAVGEAYTPVRPVARADSVPAGAARRPCSDASLPRETKASAAAESPACDSATKALIETLEEPGPSLLEREALLTRPGAAHSARSASRARGSVD